MGVPKFYRWISERYPCLSEIVNENQLPEFDNLYLDMNGIIHTCSHPNDDDPHFRITEEQIFRDIFRYIEVLFRIIRPRKVFFMAVDGVAPRAKMNQQRGRRFMSARTALENIEEAKRKGEKLPSAERFDSNCITPGTEFMAKLQEQLKYFVNMKITTDDMWQGIRIYLSGHDVPGEGEHKIMDFIRYERSQPGYDCDTRHCLYGLDADLIMLGLSSHEPYFALLREEVKFGRPSKRNPQRSSNAEQTTFHLLHLSLLRDYIELEFGAVKDDLRFEFDLESVIDDWVLMGFLVGNDFIPHLPNLHIHSNALPTLYKAYKKVLPELGGYINEKGFLNLKRFEKFVSTLAQFDREFFENEYEDLKWLEEKKTNQYHFGARDIRKNVQRIVITPKMPKQLVPYTDSDPENAAGSSTEERATTSGSRPKPAGARSGSNDDGTLGHMSQELRDLIRRSNARESKGNEASGDDEDENCAVEFETHVYPPVYDEDDDESWSPAMEKSFVQFKRDYYMNKMNYAKVTPEVLHDQAFQYVRAIQWNLNYYYNGISSWSWFYPHHYAPYLSDVKGFSHLDIKFDLGEPFLPYQQLLAVLPAGSKKLLPSAYQPLMTDSDSPLIDFYPSDFSTDLNGKKNDWEAVILIPFIEERRLLAAMATRHGMLTSEEKERNRPGKQLLYTTASQDQGFYRTPLMGVFPDLEHNKARCTPLEPALFRLHPSKICKGLLPGVRLDVYHLGFSTLKPLRHVGVLTSSGVKVFEQPSKNESISISLLEDPRNNMPLVDLVRNLLGKQVYINWPHLVVGQVTTITSEKEKFLKDQDGRTVHARLSSKESRTWQACADEVKMKYGAHRAVDIGETNVIVYVKRLIGKKYVCSQKGQVSIEKQWCEGSSAYALQTVVENVSIRDTTLLDKIPTLDELFPMAAKVFLIANAYYGHQGTIVSGFDPANGRFGVEVTTRVEPDFSRLIANQERYSLYWYPGWQAAQKLDVGGHFLGRITGTIYVTETPTASASSADSKSSSGNRFNIGLNLKFSKKNEEVADYTKRDVDGIWLYSSNVLKILGEYLEKFPEVCDVLHSKEGGNDVFAAQEIWPENSKQKLAELVEWLKSLPSYGAEHQAAGTECVDERVIRLIESTVAKAKAAAAPEHHHVGVRPNTLFRACLSEGNASADPKADYQLFDRVVCAREGFTVPVGLRGTVVGLHPGLQEGDFKVGVIFDEEFIGGVNMRSSKNCGYRINASALINLTYGGRMSNEKKKRKQGDQQPMAAASAFEPSPRREEGRRPTAAAGAWGGGGAGVTKSGASAIQIAKRPTADIPSSSGQQGSKAAASNVSQSGKSIMNEIFPNRLDVEPKPGEIVFVNSKHQKGKRDVEESSQALRSLLRVGEKKTDGSKKQTDARTPKSKAQEGQRQQTPQSTSKTEGPRVPFTARQPQPPPFHPDFSTTDADTIVTPVHDPERSTGASKTELQSTIPPPPPIIQPQPIQLSMLLNQSSAANIHHPQAIKPTPMAAQPIAAASIPEMPTPSSLAPMYSLPPPMPGLSSMGMPFSQQHVASMSQQQMQQQAQMQQFQQHRLQQLQHIQQQHIRSMLQQQLQMQQQFQRMQIPPHLQQQFPQQPPPPQHQHQMRQGPSAPPPSHQQHQQQFREGASGHQGRQRQISTGTGGHEQFVPMQVTKKQPAPAYVKNIAAKAEAESTKNQQPSTMETKDSTSSDVQVQAGARNVENNEAPPSAKVVSQSKPSGISSGSNANSTRPKSRLAIKLAPAN